jgi:HEPN domain-containing protein
MTLGPEERDVCKRWFRRAEDHLEAARVLVRWGGDETSDAACYHSHEAVATFIKSALTLHGIVAPRIHDLDYLHRMIPESHRFDADPHDLAWLSVYGIERYWNPDRPQAEEALKIAAAIRDSAWTALAPLLSGPVAPGA